MQAVTVRRVLPIAPAIVFLAALIAYVGKAGSVETPAAPPQVSYMSIPF